MSNQIHTELERRGYTILKKDISKVILDKIRLDLTVIPQTFVPGKPSGNEPGKYFSYQESNKKIFVPHYYGVKHFGEPLKVSVSKGDDIDITFAGELRENQVPVVATYMNNINKQHSAYGVGGGLLELPCAFGKTCLSLKIIELLKKKTLIIVHKEFLMNQWIERIREFLPGAKIGKIQGTIFDIEGKDIVIGMLQSLSMKTYPSDAFLSFGLTVIDEVHHISSEVFSNALFKIVTQSMLGLSATMNRKDGTTKTFKMFLGEVVFKGKREPREVTVRGIEYISEDAEFNKLVLDYRGNPAYSTMISKLCANSDRSEFILQVIVDMFAENPNQQIMLLAHNKNVLKYLHDAIAYRSIATVGYYVGGMKELALKETESKQVVVATYAMASEALDIKSLTTLIMVTPKTDIEQSVGRILRDRFSQPVVVDIIDKHSVFQNQWRKRKTFFKKEKYTVITTKSTYYNPDTTAKSWKTVFSFARENKSCIINNDDNVNENGSPKDEHDGKCFFTSF
jgi:superfamily II DNA or RNA helicase